MYTRLPSNKHKSEFTNTHKNNYTDQINDIIEKYKIDMDNETHLEYWDAQNKRCCIPCWGGKEIAGTNYKVPDGIYALMKIAGEKETYKSYNSFIDAIESVKTKRWYYHPLAMFKRKSETTRLYESKENRILKGCTQLR